MRGSRLGALAGIVGLAALTAAVVLVIDPVGPPVSSPTPRVAGTSDAPRSTPPPTGLLRVAAAERGPAISIETPPTRDMAQSKLWVRDGVWWGLLLAEGTDEFRIHRFDWAGRRWIDTGTSLATRASVHPDVVSDGDSLWVVTGGGQPRPRSTAALFRYTYDVASMRYRPDPDFPVIIADQRADSITLARDDAGRIWAAWRGDDGIVVSRTDGNDWTWSEPQALPSGDGGSEIVAVSMVSYGTTVAVIWSDRTTGSMSLAVPIVGEALGWDVSSIVTEGLPIEEDRLSATVLETDAGPRLFVVVETLFDERPGSSRDDPRLLLVVAEPDGTSEQYLVSRVRDDQTRPIVLLDDESRTVFVVATSPSRDGVIEYKASGIDRISFAAGEGDVLLGNPGLPGLTSVASTKQTLDSSTGMLVLASDAEAGAYAWSAALLSGPSVPNISPAPAVPPEGDPLLVSTFDPFDPGASLDSMWETRSTGSATFSIRDMPDGRRVVAGTADDGSRIRMCRELSVGSDGPLRVEADVMLSATAASDATVTSIRHDGAETAVVRLDASGVFSYFDGPTEVRSDVRWVPGTWYTSTVILDLSSRTYAWTVTRASDGGTLFAVDGPAWRTSASGPATDVCLESAAAARPDIIFAVDRIRVER